MRILLNVDERKKAYEQYVKCRMRIQEDEEMVIIMPSYSDDQARIEIVKKPPQEQPQE